MHEEAGAVVIWTHRLVFCRCKFYFEQINGGSYACPVCGQDNDYYVLDEYFD